jgi:hypothetical protein
MRDWFVVWSGFSRAFCRLCERLLSGKLMWMRFLPGESVVP